jgi:transcriptional regulator with XRE-family HTH domain
MAKISAVKHGIYRVLALRLREERRRAGLSLERLGEKAGVTGAFIAHIEAERKRPTLETLAKLAWALDLPVSELLSQADGAQADGLRLARLFQDLSAEQRRKLLDLARAARGLLR